ncbi:MULTISPECIES: ABC transporter permease [Pontibacillus]|uniref:ABC transporter permease subunit n=1 Tax=Pontibacillus chungwhensis TaxID=265426 RepID=A0ABY8UZN4_9BACI|nr:MULTISPECIES: ABC transporter permease subunit [Pontibacillus]MCD5325528.1 ABC transporter permease [Pontibacillus sp. HN14]WIF98638.1 ABC transporter permease subunit [Pontibacillus chungwhensis]
MRQWMALFQKELLENWRNFKWIWVPITFILLAVMDPITTYYLPVILEKSGEMPEGTTFNFPTPTPSEAFLLSFGQLNLLGVAVVLLMTMGIIAAERKSGVTELILVKPVSYAAYITAKWASTLLLVLISLFLGLVSSWYYVNILYGELAFSSMLGSFLLYSVWMMLVLTISIFMNVFFKTPGLVGFLSIAVVILINSLSGLISRFMDGYPAQIHTFIRTYVTNGTTNGDLWLTVAITLLLIAVLLVSSIMLFRKKELAA